MWSFMNAQERLGDDSGAPSREFIPASTTPTLGGTILNRVAVTPLKEEAKGTPTLIVSTAPPTSADVEETPVMAFS